ncbi:hypothetical protein ACDZ28_10615 [Paenibacillus sp. RS8]|uniref:hypothetical protein n=1 Tax=Paenibacillus sp. RS8 TaxID=3242681 RepID=UPI0035BF9A51
MNEQDKNNFSVALAELYVRRRQEWFLAIDRVMSTKIIVTNNQLMNSIDQLELASKLKHIASGKWDQMVEVVELLPEDIKALVMQEIDRIK